MAAALLAIAPLIAASWPYPILLIFMHSPAYMVHQVEEHAGDRFRRFVNDRMFGGVDALTTKGVLWINLPGVWGVNLAAAYAACFAGAGYGLMAPYLVVVNAVGHIGASVRVRGYNPGLVTGVFLFLPLGVATIALTDASLGQHLVGIGVAVAIHLAIAIGTVRRARWLRSGGATMRPTLP